MNEDFDMLDDEVNGIEIIELYDKFQPKRGGLIDVRVGTTTTCNDPNCKLSRKHCIYHDYMCVMCGLSSKMCLGHPYTLNKARSMTFAEYIFYILKLLQFSN